MRNPPPQHSLWRIPGWEVMRVMVIVSLLAACVSCAKFEKPKRAIVVKFPPYDPAKNKNRKPVTIGSVTSVNQVGQFVLITTDGFAPPAAGSTLKAMRAGQEVGVMKVSEQKRREFYTADIVSGLPQRGDKVMQ